MTKWEKIRKLKEAITQNYEDTYDEYLREGMYKCWNCD